MGEASPFMTSSCCGTGAPETLLVWNCSPSNDPSELDVDSVDSLRHYRTEAAIQHDCASLRHCHKESDGQYDCPSLRHSTCLCLVRHFQTQNRLESSLIIQAVPFRGRVQRLCYHECSLQSSLASVTLPGGRVEWLGCWLLLA
jgi:hypothetical protein